MTGLRLALGFLTAIPIRVEAPAQDSLGRAAVWFPVVGLLLGGLLAAAHAALGLLFPPLLAAGLVVALWAVLTGGLHLDGLADCCDGLLAAVSRERRLEIMRDSRLGAFGAIGLVLFLILKVLALASLSTDLRITHYALRFTSYALLVAPALARLLLLPVALQPAARAGGLGAAFASGLSPGRTAVAAVLPLALIVLGGWRAAVAAGAACAVALGVAGLARARLGGVTGDVLGLTVELAELAALLAFAARLPP
jgi:adenosylcobinamide-GDP ribazoletransferase